jgi:hypothetical protein
VSRVAATVVLCSAALLAGAHSAAAATTVPAVADTYVDASAPKQRFGTTATLLAGTAPTRTAYVRFDLRAVTGPIARATLMLQAGSASLTGFEVRNVADSNWNERSIAYQNAPAVGSAVVGSSGAFITGPVSADITGAVVAGSVITVALTSQSTAALSFASRETGGQGPRLELETADVTAPAVSLTSPASGSTTNRVQPVFAGGAGTAAGDSTTVSVNVYPGTAASGTPVQTLQTTASGGSWSVTASAALSEGAYTARAQQADAAGNVAHSSANTFSIDITPPAVTLTNPASGAVVTATPTFAGAAGTASGDSPMISVRVFSGTATSGTPVQVVQAQAAGGAWSAASAAALSNGTYTARAEQADAAGNVGLSRAVTFAVQGAPPPAADYRTLVMSDAPRAYWRLGETSGLVAADQTSNGISGSYLNGVALARPGAIAGDANTAVGLDGVNDTVRVTNAAPLNASAAMSIEAWVRPAALPTASATIARKELQYLLRLSGTGAVTFRLWKGGAIAEATTPSGAVGTGGWAHVVATWDGATMRVHVNGTVRASRALVGPADVNAQDLYLGSSYNSYDYYAGMIDEVAVYAGALSEARVDAHYAAAAAAPGPAVTLLAPAPGRTMDATPNFGGAAAPDAGAVTVRVYSGTAASGTPVQSPGAAVQTSGTFSVRAAPLAAGTYTAVAEQSDAAGNVGRSAPSTFTVVAGGDPAVLAAGDIAACDTFGDEATAALLDRLAGTVLTVGDHVYEDATAADFANCYDPTWGRHKARTRPALGDHEYRTAGALPYFDYFGAAAGDPAKGYQSYDIGTWHVVALNEVCSEVGGCGAGSPQEQWLRADLAAHPSTCTLAILHKPRFSSGAIHGGSTAYQPFWQALYDFGAELVLSGDDHVYERFAPQTPAGSADPLSGIRQITVGTGGRSHYDFAAIQPNSEVRNNDAFGVLEVILHPTGYDWRFVPEAGRTFTDSGTSACH